MPTIFQSNNSSNSLSIAAIEVERKHIKDAYFALRKDEPVYEGEEKKHPVVKGDTLNGISKKYGIEVSEIKKTNNLKDNNIKLGQELIISTQKKKGDKVSFTKIETTNIGDEVYIIVETENAKDLELKINIRQGGDKKVIADPDKALTVQENDKDISLIKCKVGKFSEDENVINKEDFKNLAISKIILKPKEEAKVKKWNDALKGADGRMTRIYILVDADSDNNELITYHGTNPEDEQKPDHQKRPKRFLDGEEECFELVIPEKKVCPIDPKYRSHFVIHCTAGEMTETSIKSKTKFDVPGKRKRSAGHIYVNLDGTKFEVWPLTEKRVWATKIESKKGLKGQMFHIELNYGSPTKPSEAQYKTLADLYIEASDIEKCWPIIVPHIEVDRGIADGHQDPTDFDYNHFYSILKEKGVPIDEVSKFDHDRYWGHKTYKVPWGTDKTNWPPKLKGNPHK